MSTKNENYKLFVPNINFNLKQLILPSLLIIILNLSAVFLGIKLTIVDSILTLIVFVLLQPLIEEYLFRHLLQKVLLANLLPKLFDYKLSKKDEYFVIIVVAGLFSFTHFKSTIFLTIYVFLTSLIYGYSYYKTDSIIVPWFLHIINNFLAMELIIIG